MVSEVRRNIANQNSLLDSVLPYFTAFQQATEDLRLCRTDDKAKVRISEALDFLGVTLAPSFEVSAINTLTTSERLLERQLEDRRRMYADYANFLNTMVKYSETEVTLVNERVSVYHPLLSVDAPGSGPDRIGTIENRGSSNRKIILVADIDDACKDPELLNIFFDWEIGTDYQIALVRRVVFRSESFLEALGEPVDEAEGL